MGEVRLKKKKKKKKHRFTTKGHGEH